MGQKLDSNEVIDNEILQSLLLKDGEIYQHSGGDRIFSEEDLDVLCDRYAYHPRIAAMFFMCLLIPFIDPMKRLTVLLRALVMLPASKLLKLAPMALLR